MKQPFTSNDTRSPWYESFSPHSLPAVWQGKPASRPTAPAAEPPEPAAQEDAWATEALFDCYNG